MTAVIVIIAVTVFAFAGYRAWRRVRHFLHIFQLEGYKNAEFSTWLRSRRSVMMTFNHLAGLAVVVVYLLLVRESESSSISLLLLFVWLFLFGSARAYRSEKAKKPMAFTPRMKRLAGNTLLLALGVFMAAGALVSGVFGPSLIGIVLTGLLAVDALAPLLVLAGGHLMLPVENRIQEGFKQSARAALEARDDLTIIGITGSYGKTSVKFAIAEILSQRFNVLATPASYNTPMGICRVINDDLRPMHQYLVLEMGARYPGDIQELCEIARPDLAVLTSIGLAHLETMGSRRGIIRTKKELVDNMRPNGPVVANGDDEGVMEIARSASGPVSTVSIRSDSADITATDISYGTDGCRFTVSLEDESEEVQSTLLGAHNVTNILLAIGVGHLFGLRLRQMKHAVARLRPVPHRLQLRKEGPITVIDDSFNSNPIGARNAIEILGQFQTGKRVIVTPGMVELGEQQEDENRKLGEFMADHVDLVVLVGANQTEPIRDGLRNAGFQDSGVVVCQSLFEARDLLRERLSAGDIVLYENDLPDQYNES